MPLEIERKFLVISDGYRRGTSSIYRQAYLSLGSELIVRVRIVGKAAVLTVKGRTCGAVRVEFEYPIPVSDAKEILALCEQPPIEKRRWTVSAAGNTWEVDEFLGKNSGLTIAEIELADAHQEFALPDWIGQEVTDDPRYFNSYLVHHPYSEWARQDRDDTRR